MIRLYYSFSILLFCMLASQKAQGEVEFICPCVYKSGSPTSAIMQGGIRNLGPEVTGDIRVLVIAQKQGSDYFLGEAYFPNRLGVGEMLPTDYSIQFPFWEYNLEGDYEIRGYLQETVDGSWVTQDEMRFVPEVFLDEATGGSGYVGLYLDGIATATFSSGMDEVTINLPAIKNTSPTDTVPPLSVHLGLFATQEYWAGYYRLWEYPLEYSLEPYEESEAVSITMPFGTITDYEYVHLSLKGTDDAQHYLWQNVSAPIPVQHRDFQVNSIDTLKDTDSDGVSDFNESLMQTNPGDAASRPDSSILDVMVLYTPGVKDLYADLEARIIHVLEYGNSALEDSGVDAVFRLVHLEEVQFSELVQDDIVLDAMIEQEGVFSDLYALRSSVGADLVILYRPLFDEADSCGIGNLTRLGFEGDFKDAWKPFSTAYIDCHSSVTSHEFGHNMGLAHDKLEVSDRGTFFWSRGHGIDGEFVTIMSYADGFSWAPTLRKFSTPNMLCVGNSGASYDCGTDRMDLESGADAALSLNTVRFQVANWASDPPDSDSDGLINFEDLDDDNDGVLDDEDAFPLDLNESLDTDLDGIGNNADADDDNDGMPDVFELNYGFNPLDENDANIDGDGDGETNLFEFNNGTDPSDSASVSNVCLKPDRVAPLPTDSSLQHEQSVYFVNPGSNLNQQTFLRFVNNNATQTDIELYAIDDRGNRSKRDPITFTLPAQGAKQINSQDIETGNMSKGIDNRLCDGQGKWQLAVRSSNPIKVMGLIRTTDGFLTSLNDVVPEEDGSNIIYFANPASNTNQQTFIRVVNTTENSGTVTITGIDDIGITSAGSVSFTLDANQAKQMTAQDLEKGNLGKGLIGSLGDGTGKWRLTVASSLDLKVMSLIRTQDGFLTNLSGMVGTALNGSHEIHFANPASQIDRQTFLRIIKKDNAVGTVTISAIDDNGNIAPGGDVMFTLRPFASKQMVSGDLENGNLNKGLSGLLGSGNGRWQLTVSSSLDLEVMSLVRTPDGFLTTLSRTVPVASGLSDVFIFNPASNTNQRSSLRIVNTSSQQGSVMVTGFDDGGSESGEVNFNIMGSSAISISSEELEKGSEKFVGALGDGAGKWRLQITSDTTLQVQSLLDTPAGFLTNLSRVSE